MIPIQSPAKQLSPWEALYKTDPIKGFLDTFKLLMARPVQFFSSLQITGSVWPVVIFATLVQTIGLLATFGYQALIALIDPVFSGALLALLSAPVAAMGWSLSFVGILGLLVIPVLAFLGVFVSTAIVHLSLWIVRGTNQGFEATLQAVGYSSAVNVFQIVPFFGGLVAPVWQLVLLVIGLKSIHQISYGRSILAILLPLLVCCCLGGIGFGGLFTFLLWPAINTP